RLAVRRQRQRLVVDDHRAAPARADADSAREQPGSGSTVSAVRGRCHRLAVRPAVPLDFRAMSVRDGVSSAVILAGILLVSTRTYAEDRQIRPFIGATFAGATTFVDLEDAAGRGHLAIGASAGFPGGVLGAAVGRV